MLAMGKIVTFFLLTALMLGALAHGRVISSTSHQRPQPWKQFLEHPDGEFHTIEFFMHQFGIGPHQNVWDVASANITSESPSSFGLTQVVDYIISYRPELGLFPLGRVQGTVTYADLHKTAVSVNLNFIFTEVEEIYKGSTLSVQGRYPVSDDGDLNEHMLAIVGGTGSFWLPMGIISLRDVHYDDTTRHLVTHCSVRYIPGPTPPLKA